MNNNASAKSLIARIEMFIQQGDWESAKTYVEHVLDEEPENGYVYFLKMMVQRKVQTDEELIKVGRSVTADENYPYIQLFGSSDLVDRVNRIEEQIIKNHDLDRKNEIYQQAKDFIKQNTAQSVTKAVEYFRMIPGWKDADSQIPECLLKIKDLKYDDAVKLMRNGSFEDLVKAIAGFEEIKNWKDSEDQIQECKKKIEENKQSITSAAVEKINSQNITVIEDGLDEIKDLQYINNKLQLGEDTYSQYIRQGEAHVAEIKAKRKTIAKRVALGTAAGLAVIAGVLFAGSMKTKSDYEKAVALVKEKQYEEAYELFSKTGYYKDSIDQKIDIEQEVFKSQILNSGQTDLPFGQYKGNDIEWIVLEVNGDQALLVSKYVLDSAQFNSGEEEVPYEQCAIYKTVNENMYDEMFSEKEKSIILETVLDAPEEETEPKNEQETSENTEENNAEKTEDENTVKTRVFLLSADELEKYFDEADYIAMKMDGKASNYWLRTPGAVNKKGIMTTEDFMLNQEKGIRPAIWINLSEPSEVIEGSLGNQS